MAAGAHPMMGTALHAFEATEATHIALSCGQRVRIIEERDDGWSYGEADQTGERGIFPTSYVQPDDQDGAHAETSSLAPKLPRSDSFTTVASRRATLPNIAAAQSTGQRLRGDLAKALSSTNADEVPDVSPWDSVSCFGDAQEEPELRSLGDSGGSGLGLTSDEVANLLGSIELKNVEQLQHWARTEPITGGDLEQLLFLERAEADAILLNAGLSSALHRGRLLSQVQGWSQCGVPPRLIKSPSPGPVHAIPLAAPTRQTQWQKPAAAAESAEAKLTAPGEWSIDAVTVSTFSQMFANACASQGPGTDRLGKAEAGPVLTMSGLPTETLLQIWSLADVDGDDRLDLRGYLLCCWLVQRSVQRQLPPPASLPPELLASATAAVAPSTVSTSTKAQPGEATHGSEPGEAPGPSVDERHEPLIEGRLARECAEGAWRASAAAPPDERPEAPPAGSRPGSAAPRERRSSGEGGASTPAPQTSTPRARPQSASSSREGRHVAAARRRQEAARARANPVVPPPLPPGYGTEELHSEEEGEEAEARERGERASGAGRSGGVPGLGGLAELRDLADMLSSDEEVEDAPPNPSPSPNPNPSP